MTRYEKDTCPDLSVDLDLLFDLDLSSQTNDVLPWTGANTNVRRTDLDDGSFGYGQKHSIVGESIRGVTKADNLVEAEVTQPALPGVNTPSSAKALDAANFEDDDLLNYIMKNCPIIPSEAKPYQCDDCKARFRRLHDLKRHAELHTGERLHICPECDRSFTRGDALARHYKGQICCDRWRSSIGSFEGDGNRGERKRAADGDESPADILYDAELKNEESDRLVEGKPPSLLQAPTTDFGLRSLRSSVSGPRRPRPQMTMAAHIATETMKAERENEIDWALKRNESPSSDKSLYSLQASTTDFELSSLRSSVSDPRGPRPQMTMAAHVAMETMKAEPENEIDWALKRNESPSSDKSLYSLQAPTANFELPSLRSSISDPRGPRPQMTMTERENEIDWALKRNESPPSDDSMSLVESQVLSELLESKALKASLAMDWDLPGFMKSQYVDSDNANLGSVITLSGTVQNAQATTCSEYARQTWPSQGLKVVKAFQSAVGSREHKAQVSIDNIDLDIELGRDGCVLKLESNTSNDLTIITEVFQQAVWMGAALRVSTEQRIQYSSFELKPIGVRDSRDGASHFRVAYDTTEVSKEEQSCWLPIFTNPVIARRFPVPERRNGEQGLEVPLEIMAALGGARHVTEFEGGLVLKGYSAMFVPTERHKQSIQWHLIRHSDEQRIIYRELRHQCPNRAMLEEVDHESLRTTRAFLGWWKSSETHLGTGDAAYDSIDWSPADEAQRSTRFSGANLGFQTMITGQLNFVLGAKDGRLHFAQKGPFQRIVQCAEKTPVVLYDLEDRRAWFVPALDVMLHIVQTRHHFSPYSIDGRKIELTPVNPVNERGAATEAVAANQLRQLYECDVATEKGYYFRDAILDIWSQMERLMEKDDSIEASPGLALRGTMQSKVHGWEYMSLVHEKNYRRKEATIAKSSGGWVDLIKDVNALVLFATGLGEIIRPVTDLSKLCAPWRSLPKGKDYLAAGVPILELLYSEAGSRISHKHLSTSHLQWHRGFSLFEWCSYAAPDRCECDRTQQIYHDSLFKTFGRVRPPGHLEENGCAIFGQAHHPFRPPKTVPIRQNAVHMLPNPSIQDGGPTKRITKKDDGLLSPPPVSVSPESEEVNGYGIRTSKTPPSPLSFAEQEMAVQSKRRRRHSHTQMPMSDTCDGPDKCNDQLTLPDDCAICPAEYQLMLKHNIRSTGAYSASTQTASPSKAKSTPGHPFYCSCTSCLVVDFEPPSSIQFVGITKAARYS